MEGVRMSTKLSIEEKISRVVTGNGPMSELSKKVDRLILNNLEEALTSKVEFIKQKAEQLSRQAG